MPMSDLANLPEFLQRQTFVAFDTETTGMWAMTNRIVEIAAVKFSFNRGDTDTFQSLVNPDRHIPEEVTQIHGITDDMVNNAPPIRTVLADFLSFCGDDSVLVAHNAPFDISFIGSELDRAGLEFGENPILDTVDIYHRFFPGLESYSLLNLARHFEIAQSQEHRALSDAELVKKLVLKAAEKMVGLKDVTDLERILTVYRMSSWRREPALLPDEFADIQQAIENKMKLQIIYNHPVKSSAARTIHPQQVFKLGSVFYINAYCELAGAERTFRLDRILSYKVLTEY